MNANIIPFKSDWPLHCMSGEVWLRIRRLVTHKLEREGLWPSTMEYSRFMKRQKKIGDKMISETLRKIVGDADYVLLNSEFIFATGNVLIRKRLPYVASFGYNIGLIIYNLINEENTKLSHEVSEISSVFNVGIAIFDYILDNESELFREFTNIINNQILCKISTDKQTCQQLLVDCKNISSTELRLLSKIILWFFLRLHSFYSHFERRYIWKRLVSCIVSAYNAEIRSSEYDIYTNEDTLITSKRKSTLPFTIIYFIALFISISNSPIERIEKTHKVYRVSIMMGEIFWYVDDLVDLLKDLESDHLNSILSRVYKRINLPHASKQKYQIVGELLNGSYIEDVVNQIYSKIAFVLNFLELNKFEEKDIKIVRNLIMCFVRSWTE